MSSDIQIVALLKLSFRSFQVFILTLSIYKLKSQSFLEIYLRPIIEYL